MQKILTQIIKKGLKIDDGDDDNDKVLEGGLCQC